MQSVQSVPKKENSNTNLTVEEVPRLKLPTNSFYQSVSIWQFKNELFNSYTSHHFTPHGRYELNKLTSLPMCGFIAQLVEQRTSNAEVTGSNSVEALILSRLLLSNCLNCKIYCDDHSSLSKKMLFVITIWILCKKGGPLNLLT